MLARDLYYQESEIDRDCLCSKKFLIYMCKTRGCNQTYETEVNSSFIISEL